MNTPVPKKFKILLIGDACTDIYQYGIVNRISPEAPVPIFEYTDGEMRAGMSGNVKNNLETLGCEVIHLHGNLSTKTRLIDQRSKQQVLRIDEDSHSLGLTGNNIKDLTVDCIVVSDYDKGYVTYELVENLRSRFNGPIYIDTKKTDLAKFDGCYVKVNQLERSRAISVPNQKYLIVTQGPNGATWDGNTFTPDLVSDITDVTGAGDTFLAALVYKHLETGDMATAIKFANRASGVTIKHVGVYAPRLEEIG